MKMMLRFILITSAFLLNVVTAHGITALPADYRSDASVLKSKSRPSLINYDPVARSNAVWVSPDKMARFTVLTDRVIRMEYAARPNEFEDHSTIAILNRNTPLPEIMMQTSLDNNTLTIQTAAVTLTYVIGSYFSESTLFVTSRASNSNSKAFKFKGWAYGKPSPGNLLGTIRGLDTSYGSASEEGGPSLNCTANTLISVNDEHNHCEWGLISRDGWAVYDDSHNFILDDQDWWVPNGDSTPNSCAAASPGDANISSLVLEFPYGLTVKTEGDCCRVCTGVAECAAWVFAQDPATPNCWPLSTYLGTKPSSNRVFGVTRNIATRVAGDVLVNTDVVSSYRSKQYPSGLQVASQDACLGTCLNVNDCVAYIFASESDSQQSNNCWPLAGYEGTIYGANRFFGVVQNSSLTKKNADKLDLYGFFHSHDYEGALLYAALWQDNHGAFVVESCVAMLQVCSYSIVRRSVLQVPKSASGIWWSKWVNINQQDVLDIVETYESNRIPLDVFVFDMNWHSKNAWTGWSFDSNLFPNPADSMQALGLFGLPVSVNLHDLMGVGSWEEKFIALRDRLGLPTTTSVVPFNLINSTVAYAVSDIVWGDLVATKGVTVAWLDWQQGGPAGGMSGFKQNPTIWLAHLRGTDNHRNNDPKRAMSLGRWGGLGAHRYQVGFSGDVPGLSWRNLAYQPYFSATAANVGYGFWSHDIVGPWSDHEMWTRWVQVGAYSGIMRTHDRGMSSGSCFNSQTCAGQSDPWNIPEVDMPVMYHDALRDVLQARATLLPYIYNGFRSAFDTGLGLIRPMYYAYPEQNQAYAMDATGNNVQYLFGPSILFSPVVAPSLARVHPGLGPQMSAKTTWLPPGSWFDACSGNVTFVNVTRHHTITKLYWINEVPLFYVGGSVIPYIPLRSIPSVVGNAAAQYTFLGFKVVPNFSFGSASTFTGASSVYEDDGSTTAYLTDNAYAWTTGSYELTGNKAVFSIKTNGSYDELPSNRAYQIRFLNSPPIIDVTANGVPVAYNRFGRISSNRHLSSTSQYYWDSSPHPYGMGGVVDIVHADTSVKLIVTVIFAPNLGFSEMAGVYGAIMHGLWAKSNLDIDHSIPGFGQDVVDQHTKNSTYINLEPARDSATVLASMGQQLEYLAGANVTEFAACIRSIPHLRVAALDEIAGSNLSPRVQLSLDLLSSTF